MLKDDYGKEKLKVLEAFGEPIADGGQEAFVFNVIDKMNMDGISVDCLTAYDIRSDYYRALTERKGGKIYALNLPFKPGKSRANIYYPFKAFLKEHPYDVVHIHSGSISVLAIMAVVAGREGVKRVIVHSHVDGEKDNLKHKVLRYAASLLMARHVDIYCACSRKAAEWKFEPRYAKRTHIIKNGIDTKRFRYDPLKRKKIREELGLKDSLVIGHVGRFTYQKNQEFLIDLLGKIVQASDIKLLLVGDGEERERIEALISDRKLEKNIILTGSVTNVEDYLQAMDIFCLPSRFEGLGIVAIEAQCAGLPVIASDKVPKDIDVTDAVKFLSLENIDEWVYTVQHLTGKVRRDNSLLIKKSGFDAYAIAGKLKKMYTR